MPEVESSFEISLETFFNIVQLPLDGAINIEWQDILKISSTYKKDEEIYLYCRSGNRSGKANKILIDAGYTNTINAGSIKEASELLSINIVNEK